MTKSRYNGCGISFHASTPRLVRAAGVLETYIVSITTPSVVRLKANEAGLRSQVWDQSVRDLTALGRQRQSSHHCLCKIQVPDMPPEFQMFERLQRLA